MEYVVRKTKYGYCVFQLIKLGTISAKPYKNTVYKVMAHAHAIAEQLTNGKLQWQ